MPLALNLLLTITEPTRDQLQIRCIRGARPILRHRHAGAWLAGAVDGDHYFEAIANDAVFEYRYVFPGFPTKVEGRDALMALYAGYGDSTVLHSGDGLIVHRSQDPRVLILEYEVHGKKIRTGNSYDNRFISSKIARSCIGVTTWIR